jgi:holo-[acyl-carrier protein] synthase
MIIGSHLQSLRELKRRPGLFRSKAIFTASELAYCSTRRDSVASLGGILCAKEACIKAFSAFDRLPIFTFLDIEITHLPNGRPRLRAGRRLAQWLERNHLHVDVTISHSDDYATATAILTTKHQEFAA